MKKLIILTLTSFLLVGCGSQTKNKDWNEHDRNIIKEHFYDIELPHPDVKDLNELSFDSDRTAYLLGGESNKETLDAYASKFSNDWKVTKYDDGGYYYYFGEIELNLDVGKRFVCTQFYNVDERQEITLESTGNFFAKYYDPYYYAWPSVYVNEMLEKTDETVSIPEVNSPRYGVNDMFSGLGLLAIYCYEVDSTITSTYGNALKNNGFTCKGLDNRGKDVYVSNGETITLNLDYDETRQRLSIMLSVSEPPIKNWPEENIKELVKTFFDSEETIPTYTNADSYEVTDEYFEEYDCLSVFCYTENSESANEYGEILKNASWTTDGTKDEDGYIEYKSPNGTLSIETGFNESNESLDIYIYDASYEAPMQYICAIEKRAAYGLGVNRTDFTTYFGPEPVKICNLKFNLENLETYNTIYLNFDFHSPSVLANITNVYFEFGVCDKNENEVLTYYDKLVCISEGSHTASFDLEGYITGDLEVVEQFIEDYKNTGLQNYQVYLKLIRMQ